MRLNTILVILLCSSLWQLGFTQRAQSRLDSTSFLIGDQSRLIVEGVFPTAVDNIEFLKTTLDSMEAIEFVSQSPIFKEVIGGNTHYTRELLIAFFDTGAYYIPSIPVTITTAGTVNTILTAPIPVMVRSVASDSSYVVPIKPIIKEPWVIWDAWPILVAVLGIVFLLGLIFYRRKKRQATIEIIEIPKTPIELAMIELTDLENQKFIQKGRLKEHYAQLSFILRSYLERQFEFPALESTTREIGYSLNQAKFEANTKEEVINRLQQIDLIKFAKVQPDLNEVEHAVAKLRNQIQQLNQLVVTTEVIHDEETTGGFKE